MKKIFSILALVVITLTANAQNEMVTYNGEKFSVQHPKEYADVVDDWTPGVVNEWKKDDNHKLSVWPDDYSDVTLETLNYWGEYKKQEFEQKDEGWKVDDPVVKGKYLTIRMTAGDIVQYFYFVVEDGLVFEGKMSFLTSEESKYKPVFDAVLASIKKK